MTLLKRFVTSSAFESAAGAGAASYLRQVWMSMRTILELADIYETVQMPAILAMWHGQHLMAPFIKRDDRKADEATLESARQQVESELNRVTTRAYALVDGLGGPA